MTVTVNPIYASPEGSIIGGMAQLSADVLVAPSSATNINLDTKTYDNCGCYVADLTAYDATLAGIGGFVVPAGMRYVKASFVVSYDATTAGTFREALCKFKGQAVTGALGMPRAIGFVNNASVSFEVNAGGAWKACSPGDWISLRAYHDDTTSNTGTGINVRSQLTWCAVEFKP